MAPIIASNTQRSSLLALRGPRGSQNDEREKKKREGGELLYKQMGVRAKGRTFVGPKRLCLRRILDDNNFLNEITIFLLHTRARTSARTTFPRPVHFPLGCIERGAASLLRSLWYCISHHFLHVLGRGTPS